MANDIYVTFGGDTSALEANLASAKAAVNAFATEVRTLAREMQTTGAAADSELGQKVLAAAGNLTQAKAAVAGLKGELKGIGGEGEVRGLVEQVTSGLAPVAALTGGLREIGEAAAAAFAIERIAEFVSSMAELGEQTERTSKILGISTEQVGELKFAFAATGTDASNLDQMMGRFELSLAKAQAGIGPTAAGLKALGLSAQELIGLQFPEQLDKIAQAVSRFADGPTKMAALQALGRGFVELIPLLDQGAGGYERLKQAADQTNSTLDETTTGRLSALSTELTTLKGALAGVSQQGFTPFIDVARAASQIATDWAESISNSAKQTGPLKAALDLIAFGFKLGESEIVRFSESLRNDGAILTAFGKTAAAEFSAFGKIVADVFKALANGLPQFFTGLLAAGQIAARGLGNVFVDAGTVIADVFMHDYSGAKAALDRMATDSSGAAAEIKNSFAGVFDFSAVREDIARGPTGVAAAWKEANEAMLANAETAKKERDKIWGTTPEMQGPPAPPATQQVPNLDIQTGARAKDAAEAVKLAFQSEVEDAQAAAKKIEETLNAELKTHQLTMSQWLAQTEGALSAEQDAIKAAGDKAVASAKLTSNQKIAIANQEKKELDKIALQRVAAEDKAAEQVSADWKKAMDTLNGALEGQINGLLTGVTTWRQAVKNVLTSLTEDIIKFFLKWGLESAENVAKQLLGIGLVNTGTVAGAATQTAAVATGAAAQKAINASTITGDASRAAAGAYAAVAGIPIIGPILAPIAAGVAFAGVEAFGSMDIGAWQIPENQLALVHKNELVMPAAQAGAFRDMLSNGGAAGGQGGGKSIAIHPTTHLHVSAIDAGSVKQLFRDRSSDVMKAIDESVRHGAHLGLRGLARA